jgi:hypothetical protein
MAVLPAVSGRAISLAVVTVVLAAASLEGPFREWRGTGALAAAAAALACMAGHPADLTLAAEGLLILGYLGLLAAPPNPHGRATRRWLRQQLPLAACGITATVLVLFLLTVPVPTSAWLVAAGAAGAVAAAALALPRRPREPR